MCTHMHTHTFLCFVNSVFLPISFRVTSLTLGQSSDCPSASGVTLKNMGKFTARLHTNWFYSHSLTKHNQTVYAYSGIIPYMRPANEWRRYIVTSSLIGLAHTQNDACIFYGMYYGIYYGMYHGIYYGMYYGMYHGIYYGIYYGMYHGIYYGMYYGIYHGMYYGIYIMGCIMGHIKGHIMVCIIPGVLYHVQ